MLTIHLFIREKTCNVICVAGGPAVLSILTADDDV